MQLTVRTLLSSDPMGSFFGVNFYYSSGTQATINYKMRDKFSFKVGQQLTLENIYFNAIDSIFTPNSDPNGCLTYEGQCCKIEEDSLVTVNNNFVC